MKETRRNIHDNNGNSECEILAKKEIVEIIEKWEEENDCGAILAKEGLFMTGSTYNIRVAVRIDARDGEISTHIYYPNQYNNSDSFFIDLVEIRQVDFCDSAMVEGADMVALLTPTEIENLAGDNAQCVEKEPAENGKYKVCWYGDNEDYISAEDFINLALKEDYDECVENYENWLIEDVRINWGAITEYYSQ